jgi:hypothetical protein
MQTRIFIPALFLFALFAGAASAEDKAWKQGEISLYAGFGHSRARGSSFYHLGWASGASPNAETNTSISASSKDAIYFGAFFSFFIDRDVGFQTGFGYLKSDVPNTAVFDLSTVSGKAALRDSWPGTGEITAVPLCLNVAGRFGDGKFRMGVTVGVALFLNSFFADSYAGAAVIPALPEETFDAFRIKIAVEDKTWSALGGNFGWSGDFQLSSKLALTAEARYFFCPIKTLYWTWIPGDYAGLLGNFPIWNFDKTSAADAESRTSPLSINPSFFTVSIGIKFLR